MSKYEELTQEGLTEEQFDDYSKIIFELIGKLVDCADKHNLDRNDFMKYASTLFKEMVSISTFERWGSGEGVY